MDQKSQLFWIGLSLIIWLFLCERMRRLANKHGSFKESMALVEAQMATLDPTHPTLIYFPPIFTSHVLAIAMYLMWFGSLIVTIVHQISN